jgi:hypothetical protein
MKLILFILLTGLVACQQSDQTQGRESAGNTGDLASLSGLTFKNDFPTSETAVKLMNELTFQQAVQSYLWALPAVNIWAMKEASEKGMGAGYHVLPIWAKRMTSKTLVTTPNADVIYAMGYVDLSTDGPLVVEVPPMLQGLFDDFWQRPLVCEYGGKKWLGDVGLAGPDGGKGGKFLLLPPGYKGAIPKGYFVYPSRTYNVFVFWRSFFRDPKQLDPAVSLIKKTRIYPLGKEVTAKAMSFPDATDAGLNMLFPEDGSYFDMLSRFINAEYADKEDVYMRGMLAELGIVKGRAFNPDAKTKVLLDEAAKTAFKMSKVIIDVKVPAQSLVYKDRQWMNVFVGGSPVFQGDSTYTNLDLRTAFFTSAYSTSEGMALDIVGKGAKYPGTIRDADGHYVDGAQAYSLHLPANVPAGLFWSISLYDALTASGLDNGQAFFSINSMDKPEQNADGSYDLYLGPRDPGKKNWLKTVPGKGFLIVLRLYGPAQSYFDQSWKPDDLKVVR